MFNKKPHVVKLCYFKQNEYKVIKKIMFSTDILCLKDQKENVEYKNFSEKFLELE